MVKLGSSKNYLKVADLLGGEVVAFCSEGEWVESRKFTYDDGTPRRNFVIKVQLAGADEPKDMTLNKTNRDTLIEAYSDDTVCWLGKKVRLDKAKVMVGGKMLDTVVVVPVDPASAPAQDAGEAVVNLDEGMDVGEDAIPF